MFNYIKTLTQFRLKSSAIKTGKFMQFLPVEGVYVYFRYDNNQTVMCLMNTNKEPKTIELSRFAERMKGFKAALDVAAGQTFQLEKTITLMPVSNLVLELR
jgi:neopullulanase